MRAPPWIDIAHVPRPTGAPTHSRRFAQELADAMHRGEVKRFDRALQNIEIGAEHFVRSRTNAQQFRCTAGMAVMDSIAPGETLIVYADGRKKGGVGVANPALHALAESISAAKEMTGSERRRALVDTAIGLRPSRRPEIELLDIGVDIVVLAGLLLSDCDLEFLASVHGAIPAVAIIALTDTRGRPSVETRHLVTRFPGRWLGTAEAAGRA